MYLYLLIKVKAAMHTRHLSDRSSGIHPSPRLGPTSSRDTMIRGCARALAGKKKKKKVSRRYRRGRGGGSFVMGFFFKWYLSFFAVTRTWVLAKYHYCNTTLALIQYIIIWKIELQYLTLLVDEQMTQWCAVPYGRQNGSII